VCSLAMQLMEQLPTLRYHDEALFLLLGLLSYISSIASQLSSLAGFPSPPLNLEEKGMIISSVRKEDGNRSGFHVLGVTLFSSHIFAVVHEEARSIEETLKSLSVEGIQKIIEGLLDIAYFWLSSCFGVEDGSTDTGGAALATAMLQEYILRDEESKDLLVSSSASAADIRSDAFRFIGSDHGASKHLGLSIALEFINNKGPVYHMLGNESSQIIAVARASSAAKSAAIQGPTVSEARQQQAYPQLTPEGSTHYNQSQASITSIAMLDAKLLNVGIIGGRLAAHHNRSVGSSDIVSDILGSGGTGGADSCASLLSYAASTVDHLTTLCDSSPYRDLCDIRGGGSSSVHYGAEVTRALDRHEQTTIAVLWQTSSLVRRLIQLLKPRLQSSRKINAVGSEIALTTSRLCYSLIGIVSQAWSRFIDPNSELLMGCCEGNSATWSRVMVLGEEMSRQTVGAMHWLLLLAIGVSGLRTHIIATSAAALKRVVDRFVTATMYGAAKTQQLTLERRRAESDASSIGEPVSVVDNQSRSEATGVLRARRVDVGDMLACYYSSGQAIGIMLDFFLSTLRTAEAPSFAIVLELVEYLFEPLPRTNFTESTSSIFSRCSCLPLLSARCKSLLLALRLISLSFVATIHSSGTVAATASGEGGQCYIEPQRRRILRERVVFTALHLFVSPIPASAKLATATASGASPLARSQTTSSSSVPLSVAERRFCGGPRSSDVEGDMSLLMEVWDLLQRDRLLWGVDGMLAPAAVFDVGPELSAKEHFGPAKAISSLRAMSDTGCSNTTTMRSYHDFSAQRAATSAAAGAAPPVVTALGDVDFIARRQVGIHNNANTMARNETHGVRFLAEALRQQRTLCAGSNSFSGTENFRSFANIGGYLLAFRLQYLHELSIMAAWRGGKQSTQVLKHLNELRLLLSNPSVFNMAIRALWCVSTKLALDFDGKFAALFHVEIVSAGIKTSKIREISALISANPSVVRGNSMAYRSFLEIINHPNRRVVRAASIGACTKEFLFLNGAEIYSVIADLTRCDALNRQWNGDPEFHMLPTFTRYCLRSLAAAANKDVLFYLPQLIQLLRRDPFGALAALIESLSTHSALICHRLVWLLQAEEDATSAAAASAATSSSTAEDPTSRDSDLNSSSSNAAALPPSPGIIIAASVSSKKSSEDGALPKSSGNNSNNGDVPAVQQQYYGLCDSLRGKDPLPALASQLRMRILHDLASGALRYLEEEVEFFNFVTSISGVLKEIRNKELHPAKIVELLKPRAIPAGLYMPTKPLRRVVGINFDSACPMQSAAKCPYLLQFFTVDWDGPGSYCDEDGTIAECAVEDAAPPSLSGPSSTPFSAVAAGIGDRNDNAVVDNEHQKQQQQQQFTDACIFKVFDDCRQDCLTIQVVHILWDHFCSLQLPAKLVPYDIIPTRTGVGKDLGGILQVVPLVKSRDQIGKAGSKTLLQYFINQFGPLHSQSFIKAHAQFVKSLAASAVMCYILHIKDRHNGNILIDDEGAIVHIDYGFILGISPGKNMGFETAAFKFSSEMVQLLTIVSSEESLDDAVASIHSSATSSNFPTKVLLENKAFCNFQDLVVHLFLAAREKMDEILTTVCAYADSDLPCFKYKRSVLSTLRGRFMPHLLATEAAAEIRSLVMDAAGKWTTSAYDGVQKLQNNIYSDAWR
jgi:hypothetical protein